MKLHFAGCARDCAQVIASNILSILAIGDAPWCDELRIYIAENNSGDATRDIIARLANQDSRIVPIFLDDLDKVIPVREARIAYCRDRLLYEIYKNEQEGLYISIDLDSNIASSLNINDLLKACRLVTLGKCTGVFPSSFPFYYDIHALREASWCPRSCWKDVYDANARSNLWNFLAYIFFVSSKQHHYLRLQDDQPKLIPVNSAFGGMGIYSLSEVAKSGAHYSSSDLEHEQLKLCEHVVFNSFLEKLFIDPQWVIAAPLEHIEFRLLPNYQKVWRIARAALADFKWIGLASLK